MKKTRTRIQNVIRLFDRFLRISGKKISFLALTQRRKDRSSPPQLWCKTLNTKLFNFYGIVESQNYYFWIYRPVFVYFWVLILVIDPYYGGDSESWENFQHIRHQISHFYCNNLRKIYNTNFDPQNSYFCIFWAIFARFRVLYWF